MKVHYATSLGFFYIIKPRRKEYLPSQWIILSEPVFNKSDNYSQGSWKSKLSLYFCIKNGNYCMVEKTWSKFWLPFLTQQTTAKLKLFNCANLESKAFQLCLPLVLLKVRNWICLISTLKSFFYSCKGKKFFNNSCLFNLHPEKWFEGYPVKSTL